MTQNSEQVKAIAEKIKQAEDDCYDSGHMELDSTMFHEVVFNILTEALSTQPTVTASAEELAEPTLSAGEIRKQWGYEGKPKQWQEGFDCALREINIFQLQEPLRKREAETAELRKELEEAQAIADDHAIYAGEVKAENARLTAEVERLKLFRKNVVEFLLLSEKQGSIVSSNQCTDTETAFASADDRFFVVDNSANDKYQNLGFVYRKASRGKDEAVTAQHTANRKD